MGSTSSLIAADMNAETLETLKSMLVSKCLDILKDHPGNRCCKYCIEYIQSEEGKSLSNEGLLCFYFSHLYFIESKYPRYVISFFSHLLVLVFYRLDNLLSMHQNRY